MTITPLIINHIPPKENNPVPAMDSKPINAKMLLLVPSTANIINMQATANKKHNNPNKILYTPHRGVFVFESSAILSFASCKYGLSESIYFKT